MLPEALRWFTTQVDSPAIDKLLHQFTAHFPNVAIYRGQQTVDEWLASSTAGMSNREAAFEEMMLLWLANINPAFKPFHEFFDDEVLEDGTVYPSVTTQLDTFFATRPPFDPRARHPSRRSARAHACVAGLARGPVGLHP